MKLYLMRHAESEIGDQMDPTRPLTDTGKKQAKMMGKWLKRQNQKPDLILQSNFHRSQSTAKRVARHTGSPVVTSGALDPDGTPALAIAEIQRLAKQNKAQSVLAVSHGPLVENVLGYLTGIEPEQVSFAHAAIAHIRPPRKSLKEAAGDGATEKSWVGGTCEVCQENADAGWIDIDDSFPSGDDEPPAHPSCDCDLDTRDANGEDAGYLYPSDMIEAAQQRLGLLHWLVSPNVVARDQDEMDLVTSDAHATVEAALAVAETAVVLLSD